MHHKQYKGMSSKKIPKRRWARLSRGVNSNEITNPAAQPVNANLQDLENALAEPDFVHDPVA